MSFIENVLDRLFPPKKPVVVRSSLHRSEVFNDQFNDWLSEDSTSEKLLYILRMIKLELSGMNTQLNAASFNNRGSEGIIFGIGELIHASEMDFLMDWLANSVRNLGYKEQHNIRVYEETPNGTKETLRRFLKPKLVFSADEKMNHKFGNVTIEIIKENGNANNFKILSSVYTDSKYSNYGGLSELIQEIEIKSL